ncbi:hypothetical protein [Gordonia zhaorongruii]|uniref:hypothetical protein n=1 Tax=Gordonia zhaorongruii TaxID=2597659 RepID=UPI00117E2432|nr:hypothetical protein [Gordonia zhaorongruii]
MTIVYFVIAVLALAGAGVLLWLDRNRSEQVHHQRAVWGETHSFKFRDSDSKLRTVFQRAGMDAPEHVRVRDVAYGHYEGAEAVVFDLEETATIVAVRRPTGSTVTVDLRHEDVLAPVEDDVDLLGAMGARVMFASDLDAARRTCDRRMVTLATEAPDYIEILWNEGNWALGSMPVTTEDERLDVALDTVRRFADLLRVLPPAVGPQDSPDPRDPHGPAREELADEKTESLRDKERRRRAEARDEAIRADAADSEMEGGARPAGPPRPADPTRPAPAPRESRMDATPRPAARPGPASDEPSRVEPFRRPPPQSETEGRDPRLDPTQGFPEQRQPRERTAPPNLPPLNDPRQR